jgi:hypothetical protein
MSVTAFTEAIGLHTATPQKPAPPRGGRVMPQEWHERLRDAHEAHRRSQGHQETARVPAKVGQPDPASLRRALAESVNKDGSAVADTDPWSFAWRSPVTVEEFLSGADGH